MGSMRLSLAALSSDAVFDDALRAVLAFCDEIGVPIDAIAIPATLARVGTVGRIGVSDEAIMLMHRHRVLIGAHRDADPLQPVPRLWRGMQRRAGVLLDLQRCLTMPGSEAARRGNQRDVLLVAQRQVDRRTSRVSRAGEAPWGADAQRAAELCWAIAASEHREVLLVEPVGRLTPAQRDLAAAMHAVATSHRMALPRTVKAGVLSALLTGDHARSRWLVASAMTIDELRALAREAIGETGPWPVLSVGRHASFYDIPSTPHTGLAMPMLLTCVSLLERAGRQSIAATLLNAIQVTCAAASRLRTSPTESLCVQTDALLAALRVNWGRALSAPVARRAAPASGDAATLSGVRIRIESCADAAAVRDGVVHLAGAAGVELATLRRVDGLESAATPQYEARLRLTSDTDAADVAMVRVIAALLRSPFRCLLVEPWSGARAPRTAPAGGAAAVS